MIRIWSNKWNFTMPDDGAYLLSVLKYDKEKYAVMLDAANMHVASLARFDNEEDARFLVDELSWHLWNRKEFHTDSEECEVEFRGMEPEIHITFSENRTIHASR